MKNVVNISLFNFFFSGKGKSKNIDDFDIMISQSMNWDTDEWIGNLICNLIIYLFIIIIILFIKLTFIFCY